jgi:hypothetical protein
VNKFLVLLAVVFIGYVTKSEVQCAPVKPEKKIVEMVLDETKRLVDRDDRTDRRYVMASTTYRSCGGYESGYKNESLFPDQNLRRKYRVILENKGTIPAQYSLDTSNDIRWGHSGNVACGRIKPGKKKTFDFEVVQRKAHISLELSAHNPFGVRVGRNHPDSDEDCCYDHTYDERHYKHLKYVDNKTDSKPSPGKSLLVTGDIFLTNLPISQ